MRRLGIALAIMTASWAGAQTNANSVTVTATRSLNVVADQAVFSIQVTTGTKAGLSDVLAAVSGAGVTAANLSGIDSRQTDSGSGLPAGMQLDWYFTLPVPYAQLQATAAALAQAPAHAQAGISLSYSVNDTQVSAQLAAAQVCAYGDLLAEARAQAQKAAAASGKSAGTVLALSNVPPAVTGYAASALLFDPFSTSSLGLLLSRTTTSPNPCSLTVKFAFN